MGARPAGVLADLHTKLGLLLVPMTAVVDAGTPAARSVGCSWDDRAFRVDSAAVLAEHDEALLGRLVDGGAPSPAELTGLLAAQTSARLVHPVYCGSALTGVGTAALVEGIRTLLTAPAAEPTAPVRGTVFAIDRTPGGAKLAYLRLFAGELRERQQVRFTRQEPGGSTSEVTGRISALQVVEAPPGGSGGPRAAGSRGVFRAGSIGTVGGLPGLRVGDRLGGGGEVRGPARFPSPTLESVVRAGPGQEAALHAALTRLADEDPLIRTRVAGGGATSVLLYGAVQREVLTARLERDFGVQAVFGRVRPVYVERPTRPAAAVTEMNRRGPNVFWASIGLRVHPAPVGAGNSFANEAEWGALPRAFHRAIEDAALHALGQGLHGWEVTDCVVTLDRAQWAAPMSTGADFRHLTPLVLMRALTQAGIRVYEPCQSVQIELPPDTVSGTIALLSGLGADITQSAGKGTAWLVTADLPARLVPDVTAALPGLSHGEGALWTAPAPDRPVRGATPTRQRSDGNPLDYDEYLRWLSNPSLTRTATHAEASP